MPYHYINNSFYKVRSIDNNFNQFIINYFYKLINNNKN